MKLILIVDDDYDVRDSLGDLLEDEGFAVAKVADGFEALEYLRAHAPPCLILLDWMMPRCDGAQFRALQASDPDLADIPVVLLSADARVTEKMERLSASGCLSKPVGVDHLLDVVRRFCGDA